MLDRLEDAFVIEGLDRMNRMVDELIELAHAERPDFLGVGELDLADLTVDSLVNARVLAPRKWAVDAVAEGTILADGQRLTQALMQLASNAVKHTVEDDRIAIGSELVEDRLHLWVSDTGAGVAVCDRILIAEDEEPIASFLQKGLPEMGGFTVMRRLSSDVPVALILPWHCGSYWKNHHSAPATGRIRRNS